MHNPSCHEVFQKAKIQRAQNPLGHGYYKLRECRERLVSCHAEIGRIRRYLNHESARYELMHCTAEDKHIWLKDVPSHVAYRLGYEVLPGLKALSADGVRSKIIQDTYPWIEKECLALLDSLELARTAIRKNIGAEYRQMRQGRSMLEPLVEKAIVLASLALDIHP